MPIVKDYMELLYRVYMYPARFPAKIFDIFFEKLRFKGVVFDPFAGSGSLALASYLNCYDSVVWDLNPIIHVLVDAGIKVINKYSIKRVAKLLVKAERYGRPWLPSRADYWWPEEVLDIIGGIWGFFRDNLAVFNPNNMAFEALDDAWSIFAIIGLYASRKLSYADDSVPKWYKSKLKVDKITRMLSERSAKSLFNYYVRKKVEVLREIEKTVPNPQCNPLIVVRAVDAVTTSDYPDKVVGVLTSPPYLQAQEYIRSFSWELKLLGVSEETISKLRKFEIPYRPPVDIEILSDTYYEVLDSISEEKFKSLLRSYFTSVLIVLEKTVHKAEANSIIGIFAGEATVRGNPIPIAKIIGEHLTRKLQLEELIRDRLEDKIKRRRLFKGRKNLNPDGIKIEHLVFLRKLTHPLF
jgi:hypothetical protein